MMPNPSSPSGHVPREVQWLLGELPGWLRDGLLSDSQAEAIRDRYLFAGRGPGTGRLVRIVAILGAVLVGVGLILFFAANWNGLPRPLRVALVFAVILAAQIGGYRLRYERATSPRLGEALLLLGSLAYGAGIWLVAQMYHLPANYPGGALLWAVGTLAMAWALPEESLLVLATLVLSLWMAWGTVLSERVNVWFPLVLFGLVFPRAYRLQARVGVGVAVLSLGLYAGFGFFRWSAERLELVVLLYLLFGGLVYAVGLLHALHDQFARYARSYLTVGLWLVLVGTYIASFRGFWRAWHASGQVQVAPVLVLTALLAGALLLAWYLWDRRVSRTPATAPAEMIGLAVLGGTALLLFFLVQPGGSGAADRWLLPALIANLLLAAAILATIAVGFYQRQAGVVNLGLAFFCLDVVTRYFEWGWKLMDRSLFFVGAGLLLLLGGWLLERQRRRWLLTMEGEGHD